MVAAALTDDMIALGARLIRQLDARGLAPDAAFWFYVPDRQEWSLVLAETKLSAKGPRWIYRQIRTALLAIESPVPALSLDSISVVSPDHQIALLLSRALHTGPGIAGIRFTNNVIDGVPIEDAYIYRLMGRP